MKKNKPFTRIAVLLLALVMIIAIPISSAASGEKKEAENAVCPSDSDVYEDKAIEESPGDQQASAQNIFDTAYTLFTENADKLFSLFAFLASLLVGLTYKKGLIPTLSGGIGKIASEIEQLKDSTAKENIKSSAKTDAVCEELSLLENDSKILSDKLCVLEEKLDSLIPKKMAEERIRIIMSAQVDMLYDIFMASALPQYRKDDVGKRISEMREELVCLDEKKS